MTVLWWWVPSLLVCLLAAVWLRLKSPRTPPTGSLSDGEVRRLAEALRPPDHDR